MGTGSEHHAANQSTGLPRFTTVFWPVLVGFIVLAQTARVEAQPVPESSRKADAGSRTIGPAEAADNGQDDVSSNGTIFTRGKDGGPKQRPPAYSVTRIALEGDIAHKRAVLKAKFSIQIHDSDDFVKVPLQLAEATLTDFAYAGAGIAISDNSDRALGQTWWFKGKGDHQLTLSLSVSLRELQPGYRLQLSLPPTAVSKLKLRVPQPKIKVVVDKQSSLLPIIAKPNGSEITLFGLREQLDVAWYPQIEPATVNTVLDVETSIRANLGKGLISARQKIRAVAGTGQFEKLTVQIPTGSQFRLLVLDGPQYKEHRIDPDHPHKIMVQLKSPTTGPVELNWIVQANWEDDGTPITLEGFSVDRAAVQTGVIAIQTSGQHNVSQIEGQYVQRRSAGDIKDQFEGPAAAAFQFSKQPFRLVLKLQRVEPHLIVEPQIILDVAADRMEFQSVFQFQVTRGAVSEAKLLWPNWREQGWQLHPLLIDEREHQLMDVEDDTILFRFRERSDDKFSLRLKAWRTIAPGGEGIKLTLPTAEAASQLPSLVVVAMDDNVEIDFKPLGDTFARPLGTQVPPTLQLPETFAERRLSVYRVDPTGHSFSAAITVHSRSVQTETSVEASFSDTDIQVQQQIDYRVAWERLSELQLLVPAALQDRVEFALRQDGYQELTTQSWGESSRPGWKQLRLTLDKPRIGSFQIRATFNLANERELVMGKETSLTIPVIQSLDSFYEAVRFESKRPSKFEIVVADESWQAQAESTGSSVWVTDHAVQGIPLKLTRTNLPPADSVAISKAYLRSVLDISGQASHTAHFRLTETPRRLQFVLPPETEPVLTRWIFWNGKPVAQNQIIQIPHTPGGYEISVPAAPEETGNLLTILYRSQPGGSFGWSNHLRLLSPEFPGDTWVTQSTWEVVLPVSQHLFTEPVGFTSQNHWRQAGWRQKGVRGIFWSRVPFQTQNELNEWISLPAGYEDQLAFGPGNRYLFTRFGPVHQMELRSMSWPMIGGIGSGLALMLGLMFQYIPVARNVLTLLFAAFVVAAIGVWQTSPVLLLIQASGMGVLLAFISTLLQWIIHRRRSPQLVALASRSGFMTASGSSVSRDMAIGVSSKDVAAVRPSTASQAVQTSSVSEVAQ